METKPFKKKLRWTVTENNLLLEKYATSSREALLVLFPGRTYCAISDKAVLLGANKPEKIGKNLDETRKSKREFMARKRAENPEKVRNYGRGLYFANHEERKKNMRDYYQKRFFWGKAMKLRTKGRANFKELASIWRSQRGKCALTGRKLDRNAQLDHIVPRAKGGGDNKENLRWLCTEANLLKRDMLDSEMFELCEEILRHKGALNAKR